MSTREPTIEEMKKAIKEIDKSLEVIITYFKGVEGPNTGIILGMFLAIWEILGDIKFRIK